MPTKIIEVFEWYQMNVHLDTSMKLYHKAFTLVCNN